MVSASEMCTIRHRVLAFRWENAASGGHSGMADSAPTSLRPLAKSILGDDLTHLHATYQALVEQIPAVIYINEPDADATSIYVSPQTTSILGITPEAWFAGDWEERVHPDDRRTVDENYDAFIRSETEGVDEYRFIRPDGQEIWIHDRVRIIRDGSGEPILVQGVMVDVTEQKRAQSILRKQADLMQRVEAIGRSFTELVLQGAQPSAVLQSLADIVRNPVVLEDVAHQLVSYATRSVELRTLLERWAHHSREGHPTPGGQGGVIQLSSTDPACSWISVRLRDEEWGRIHVLGLESEIDDLDRLALDRAAAAIGFSLMSKRDTRQLADTARSDLIADVWQGRWFSGSDLVARLGSLGFQLSTTELVAVVIEAESDRQPRGHEPATPSHRVHEIMRTALGEAVRAAGMNGMTATVGDRVVGVAGWPSHDASAVLEQLCANAVQRLREALPSVTAHIGVSRQARPETLRAALTQASEAAAYGTRMAGTSGHHRYEDLGLLRLLGHLSDGPALSRYVEDELGPLLTHDAAGRTPLVQTLRAYLDSGAHKARAARTLHLERRSLYYRLDKIEKLLQRSLDDPASRLRLEVALQGLDLLKQRPGLGGGPVPTQSSS